MTNKTNCYSIIFTFVVVAILTSILPNVFASESNNKRYNDGYNEGYGWYANHPNDGPNNCDPDSLYTTGEGHTSTYCNGWYDGYAAASNKNNSPPPQGNYQPPQPTPLSSGSQGNDYSTGWNDGTNQAATDWNSHQFTVTSGGNSLCPSGHTDEYCKGWNGGYADEWNRSAELNGQAGGGTINWEDLCNSYGSLVGIHTPCDQLAHGTQLTPEGRTGLACLFAGGLGVLSGFINAGNLEEIKAASQAVCP